MRIAQWNESVERSEERYRGQYYLLATRCDATRRDGGRYCTNCSDTARIERFRKRGYNLAPRRVYRNSGR